MATSDKISQFTIYRRIKDISQQTLADQLGVSRSMVTKYEQGIHNPSQKVLNRFNHLRKEEGFDTPLKLSDFPRPTYRDKK